MPITEILEDIEKINLEELIIKCRYREKKFCKTYLSKFSIKGIKEKEKEPSSILRKHRDNYDIFFRGPYGIILLYEDTPQGIISFSTLMENKIILNQNQGIKKRKVKNNKNDTVGFRKINPSLLMTLIYIEFASKLKPEELIIKSSNNMSFNYGEYDLSWKHFRIFDINEYNLGFLQDSHNNWYMRT
jgi:hypothetical protein